MISQPWMDRVDPALLADLPGFSAGTLVYVGATHLLPMAERETGRFAPLALAGGVLIALLIVISAGAD